MHDTNCPTTPSSAGQDTDYKSIFNQRGNAYHQAMSKFPDARNQLFLNIISLANIQHGQTVCDGPSGGDYLQRYLPCENVAIIALGTPQAFYQHCQANDKCCTQHE